MILINTKNVKSVINKHENKFYFTLSYEFRCRLVIHSNVQGQVSSLVTSKAI